MGFDLGSDLVARGSEPEVWLRTSSDNVSCIQFYQ